MAGCGVGGRAGQICFPVKARAELAKSLPVLMVHTQPRSQLPSPEQVSLTQMPGINLALSLAHLGYFSFQKLPVLLIFIYQGQFSSPTPSSGQSQNVSIVLI